MSSVSASSPPLRRTAGDRVVLGVCGGIARTLGARPLLVRAGAVLLAAIAFPLVLAVYAAAALIVPRDDGRVLLGGEPADGREQLLGWTVVLSAGFLVLVDGSDPSQLVWPALDRSAMPFVVIAIAALLLREGRGGAAAPAVPGAQPPGTPPAGPAPQPPAPEPAPQPPAASLLPVPYAHPVAPVSLGEEPTVRIAGDVSEEPTVHVADRTDADADAEPTVVQEEPTIVRPAEPAAPVRRWRTVLLVAGTVALLLAALSIATGVALAAIDDAGRGGGRAAEATSGYRLGVGSLDRITPGRALRLHRAGAPGG